MKWIILLIFCCSSGSLYSQTLQKLSIGVQAGLTTPLSIAINGNEPDNFKQLRSADLSKGIFLQYDVTGQFYLRGTFKKANVCVSSRLTSKPADTLKFEGDYGANFGSKQLEFSIGYRKKINEHWNFTSSLGAVYLKLNNYTNASPLFQENLPNLYLLSHRQEFVHEKAVLLTGAAGLEYNIRGHAFILEAGYYKGFKTVGNSNFNIWDRSRPGPVANTYNASLTTKGDYAELRLGYRVPLKKIVNLYKTINTPRVKPTPKPDSVKNQRFTGKYWGLEIGRQSFYAKQMQERLGYTEKTQINSDWTPYLTFYKGYQFKSRLSLEGGIRIGASSIQSAGSGRIGNDNWSVLTLTTPFSVKYALPVLRNKLFVSPEVGLWQSYAFGMGSSDAYPSISFSGIKEVTHLKGYGHDYFVGYHTGLSLSGRIGKNSEIGIGYRFADRFSKKPLMSIEPDFDHTVEPQTKIVVKSNLKNDAITISFRKFLRKK